MQKYKFPTNSKTSISVSSILGREALNIRPLRASRSVGFTGHDKPVVHASDRVAVLIEADDAAAAIQAAGVLGPSEYLIPITPYILSGSLSLKTIQALQGSDAIRRIQSKKTARYHSDISGISVSLIGPGGDRTVTETGDGVLIGIVDSGFDLSHPAFRDASGKLRVEGLLDQTGPAPTAITTAQLEAGWASGQNPGADEEGHGTHVAALAGGTKHDGFEGVAPSSRFLLVKTNFRDTMDGVSWIFSQAGNRPCVVNMSLGYHWGAHDGTSLDERVIDQLSGPGKIVVVSSGNERDWRLHIGGRFLVDEQQTVAFDVRKRGDRAPNAPLNLWYDSRDSFDVAVLTPTGEILAVPTLGSTETHESSRVDVELSRESYPESNLVQIQIVVSFNDIHPPEDLLVDWGLRIKCRAAVIGRIDGWFANSGLAIFDPHSLLEDSRTVSIPATSTSCIAVASYVSKTAWNSDAGVQQDNRVFVGRISPFSGMGPTRDGRLKPDISCPGQYLTSALAKGSGKEHEAERALVAHRLVTLDGTSMAAPTVTGAVALLLQKKASLTPSQVQALLRKSARHDDHVGTMAWNPSFGHGKLDIRSLLEAV